MTSVLDSLISFSKNNQVNYQKSTRGFLWQCSIVIPWSFKNKVLEILDSLPEEKDHYKTMIDGKYQPIRVLYWSPLTSVRITKGQSYETRVLHLDEADPRKVFIARKRLKDAKEGKHQGTPILILEEKLKEALSTPLRSGVKKAIIKNLSGREQLKALESLKQADEILLSNIETAPNRLRLNYRTPKGVRKARALPKGVSIIFEEEQDSNRGWMKRVIEQAKEQGAWVNGMFFPKMDVRMTTLKRTQKKKE